jgi:hypothetical protein
LRHPEQDSRGDAGKKPRFSLQHMGDLPNADQILARVAMCGAEARIGTRE